MEYGQQYDAALHVLLWELLSKLEKLLPVPDLKQVFSLIIQVPRVVLTRKIAWPTNNCPVITDFSMAGLRSLCVGGMCPVLA